MKSSLDIKILEKFNLVCDINKAVIETEDIYSLNDLAFEPPMIENGRVIASTHIFKHFIVL